MRTYGFILLIALLTSHIQTAFAQTVIPLAHEKPTDISWPNAEKEYFITQWGTNGITNVSEPAMIMYQPPKDKRTGASVILAPGGGIYALSIESEGRKLAKRLNDKGITAFILKYRLVPTGEDGVKDLLDIVTNDNEERLRITKKVLPYSVADGLSAVEYIRTNAEALDVAPDKIGFMGFSGGGVILFGMVNAATDINSPNFYVPVYPGTDLNTPLPDKKTPPTLFIVAANDQLITPDYFTILFNRWHRAGVKTGLFIYPDGGHGFGTSTQGTLSDAWVDHVHQWMRSEGFVE